MTGRTPRKAPKEPKWNKTYADKYGQSRYHQKWNEKNTDRQEDQKPPSLETGLNEDDTPRTEVNKDASSHSCEDNTKDTSIKEMQLTDPFC